MGIATGGGVAGNPNAGGAAGGMAPAAFGATIFGPGIVA